MNTFTPIDRAVARVVTERLDRAGFSQVHTSEATGIPRATLLRRLSGASFLLTELRAVADLLGTSVTEIIAEAERAA